MSTRKPKPYHPATFQVRAILPESSEFVAGPFAGLFESEAALFAAASSTAAPLRIVCIETGRYLDDYDAAPGRAYLTARDQSGRAIRSKRYGTDDERTEAFKIMQWALSDPTLAPSDFDPRKAHPAA